MLRPLLLSAATARIKSKRFDDYPGAHISLEEDTARKCCSLCIGSVHQLVENMSGGLENRARFARWREVHCKQCPPLNQPYRKYLTSPDAVFCAIVISIARLCPFEGDGLDASTLNLSWLRCMSILDHFKPRILSVKRAVEMLRTLDIHIARIVEEGKHSCFSFSWIHLSVSQIHKRQAHYLPRMVSMLVKMPYFPWV